MNDLRKRIRRILWKLGAALVMSVHEKLHEVDKQLRDILDRSTHIATTQTALLQSSVHIVETLSRVLSDIRQLESRLNSRIVELETEVRELRSTLEQLEKPARKLSDKTSIAESALPGTNLKGTEEGDHVSPEIALISSLRPYLQTPKVLDIGAHIGDASEHLLESGYEVYSFEPYPPVFNKLHDRLVRHPAFKAFNFALGRSEGELSLRVVCGPAAEDSHGERSVLYTLLPLSVEDGYSLGGTVPVRLRTLDALHEDGTIPEEIGVIRINTAGYDLEVVRGMNGRRYPVVTVGFWDDSHPFAKQNLIYSAASMVHQLRNRGYLWHICLYRMLGQRNTFFNCRNEAPLPNSSGNLIFFQDYELFLRAQHWCSVAMPDSPSSRSQTSYAIERLF
jgi:FkbM family methyltransferase